MNKSQPQNRKLNLEHLKNKKNPIIYQTTLNINNVIKRKPNLIVMLKVKHKISKMKKKINQLDRLFPTIKRNLLIKIRAYYQIRKLKRMTNKICSRIILTLN